MKKITLPGIKYIYHSFFIFYPGVVPAYCSALILFFLTCCSDSPVEKTGLREWYIPNGIFTSTKTTPENSVFDVTGFAQEWIHILNVSKNDAKVTLTFYTENDSPKDTTFIIPVGHGHPFYIDESIKQRMVRINTLYGVRVTSNEDIMPQVTRRESETGIPEEVPYSNQLQSNIAYPGTPGKKETRWIYVDSWTRTSDPIRIEKEWLNILNPSKEEAQLTITFIDRQSGAITHTKQKIAAERMFALDLVSLPPEIFHEGRSISVLVESSVPVVVMQIRRFFHSKNLSPRGMIGVLAFPVGNLDILK